MTERLRQSLEGRRGVYLAGWNNAKREFRSQLNDDLWSRTPLAIHPIIRTHPETRRKSLFANPQHAMIAVEGYDEADSSALLEELFAHCFKDEFVYSHGWRVGDLVFWDKRCLAHVADHTRLDEPGYIRYLPGTSTQGGVSE